jgi:hypothetical protein
MGEPCTEPARHVTLLFTRNGRIVGRAVTDGVGHYRLRLPAGLYAVRRSLSRAPDWKLTPRQVRVHTGRFARIDFLIDTGIR